MPIFECDGSDPSVKWYHRQLADCVKNRKASFAAVFTSLILDFVADILLIVSPLTMLWKVKLPKAQRRLILALFSSSVFSLLASIAFCVTWALSAQFGPDSRIITRMTAQLQAAISLLVCNLLVVTMVFYRLIKRKPLNTFHTPSPPENFPPENQFQDASELEESQDHLNVEVQSTTAITFTSIFEDSMHDSWIKSSSTDKTGVESSSLSNYDEEDSRDSSASIFAPWSFSEKSAEIST